MGTRIALLLLLLLTTNLLSVNADEANTKETYAVFNNGTLTFYHDESRSDREGTIYTVKNKYTHFTLIPWFKNTTHITKVIFDTSFAECQTITSTADWFGFCENLTEIQGMNNFDTSNVTDMSSMFFFCSSLKDLDISHFDTSNVTDMSNMFCKCSSLTSLDVSNFNTSNVTLMGGMFDNCNGLTSIDLRHFDTSNVTHMGSMFRNCSGLTSLDISNFDTSNVTNMDRLFQSCSSLTSLVVSNFDTRNVTDMRLMFSGCSSLSSLDVSQFNTSNVINMSGMFCDCNSLTSLDVSHFNTSKVEKMGEQYEGGMFQSCSSLTNLDVSNFDTNNVTDMYSMFWGCSSLTSLNVTNFNTSNVINMSGMFCECSSLSSLDVSNFDTSNVTDMEIMFNNCDELKEISFSSSLDTRNLETDYSYLFDGCLNIYMISFNGDIPINLDKDIFEELGSDGFPIYLNVPEKFKTNYANIINNGIFHGGYFTLDKNNANIPISLPVVAGTHWATYYNEDFNYEVPDDVDVYVVAGVGFNQGKIRLEKVDGGIPKGVPVLLHSTSEGGFKADETMKKTSIIISANPSRNFKGVTEPTDISGQGDVYVLIGSVFVKGNLSAGSNTILPANRCYISTNSSNGARVLSLSFDDDTTTIQNVSRPNEGSNRVWFNLHGQRIKRPTGHGVYIKDGRKVVVK